MFLRSIGSPSIRRLLFLLVFLSASFLIRCYFYRPYFGIDDSNITQVYGWNLAHGNGWRYFPGAEHVEGTTSFLYTLLWAVAFLCPYPHLVMQGVNMFCCLVACWFALRCLEALRDPDPAEPWITLPFLAYILWLALNPGILTWSTITLMDSSVWTALVIMAVYLLCRLSHERDFSSYSWRMAFVTALAALTRPESVALVPVFLILAGSIAYWFSRSGRTAFLTVAFPALTYVIVGGGLTLFRYLYFGYPWPNTYYAKVSTDPIYNLKQGLVYLSRTNLASPFLIPLIVLTIVLATRAGILLLRGADSGERHWSLLSIALSSLALLTITIMGGGDHFQQGRFVVQALMLVPLPLIAGLHWAAKPPLPAPMVALCALPLLLGLAYVQVKVVEGANDVSHEYTIANDGMRLGEILNDAFPDPKPSVGVITAGGIARTYKGYVVDLLGLNNTLVAHSGTSRAGFKNHASFSTKAFYQLLPDLVFPQLVGADSSLASFVDEVTHGISYDQSFQNQYRYVELRVPNSSEGNSFRGLPAPLKRFMGPRPFVPSGVAVFIKRSLFDHINPDVLTTSLENACLPRGRLPESRDCVGTVNEALVK